MSGARSVCLSVIADAAADSGRSFITISAGRSVRRRRAVTAVLFSLLFLFRLIFMMLTIQRHLLLFTKV